MLMFVASGPLSVTAEAEAQSENKVRVAVMNFENNSSWTYWGDNLGYAAADELVTQLFGSGKFSLVEHSQLDAVLAEQNLGQSGWVNPAQAADIGRLLGVQLILTGSITKFSIDTKGGGFRGLGADGTFYLAKGEHYSVLVGQRYEVRRVIDKIRDAGGTLLDTITDTVGLLEVTRVLGQSSIGTLVKGEAAEGDTLEPIP